MMRIFSFHTLISFGRAGGYRKFELSARLFESSSVYRVRTVLVHIRPVLRPRSVPFIMPGLWFMVVKPDLWSMSGRRPAGPEASISVPSEHNRTQR